MKRSAAAAVILALALPALAAAQARVTLTTEVLRDKIKGGWAGQTIGVTFGGPTEFRYNGTMIPDYTPIAWHDRRLPEAFDTLARALRRRLRRPHLRERDRAARHRRAGDALRRRVRPRRLSALARQPDGALQPAARAGAAGLGPLAQQPGRRRHRLPDRGGLHRPDVARPAARRGRPRRSRRPHHELRRRLVRRRLRGHDVLAGVREATTSRRSSPRA